MRVPLATMLAREMRLKTFWSRPTLGDAVSVASHGIGARNAIETFWNRPSFGESASAASHDIGARNAIEIFLKSTKLWRCCECRLSRYWREKCDWKFFEVDQLLEMLRMSPVTVLAREMREIFLKSTKLWRKCECRQSRHWREKCDWKRPSFRSGSVASVASHEIGARKCAWNLLKSTKLWRADNLVLVKFGFSALSVPRFFGV